MKRIGAATALEVRATGVQYNFAPGLAVSKVTECFSDYVKHLVCPFCLFNYRFAEIQDGANVSKALAKILSLSEQ